MVCVSFIATLPVLPLPAAATGAAASSPLTCMLWQPECEVQSPCLCPIDSRYRGGRQSSAPFLSSQAVPSDRRESRVPAPLNRCPLRRPGLELSVHWARSLARLRLPAPWSGETRFPAPLSQSGNSLRTQSDGEGGDRRSR